MAQIGGAGALVVLVDRCVRRLVTDPRLAPVLHEIDLDTVHSSARDLVASALADTESAGPQSRTWDSLRALALPPSVLDDLFDLAVSLAVDTLWLLEVDADVVDAVAWRLAGLRVRLTTAYRDG
ncbi:hypothetical protein [Nocardioides rubriscoriae]|uniref:hypothetical protein n=1 Tax=Nocardioides rubriscoriae TaxID=642762 RepID=UPI0014795DD4|nr:hypothetical protein [Nocardioides rubriscoriae]